MRPSKKHWRIKFATDRDRKNTTRQWKSIKKDLVTVGMSPLLKYKQDDIIYFNIAEIPELRVGVYIKSQTYFADWEAFIDKFKPTRTPYVWHGQEEFKKGIYNIYKQRTNIWPEIARSSSYNDVSVCKHDYFENANLKKHNFLTSNECDKLYSLINDFNKELKEDPMVICMYVGEAQFFKCYKRIIIGIKDTDIDENEFNSHCDLLEEKLRNSIIYALGPSSIGDELELIINGYGFIKEKFYSSIRHAHKRFDYGL